MDPAHRARLQRSWLGLLENVTDYTGIVDGLYTRALFTSALKDRVLEKKGKDQLREILDIVPRRGPTAFDTFYQVLVDCDEDVAADLLCPERAAQRMANAAKRNAPSGVQESQGAFPMGRPDDDDDDLPAKWPDYEMHDPFQIEVTEVGSNDEWMKNKFMKSAEGKGSAYAMHRPERGIFVLISNEYFKDARANGEDLADRNGTAKDCLGLQELFKKFRFRVVLRMNQTADEMLETVQHQTTKVNPTDNCFCLAVLSHGDRGMVYGTDGKKLSLDTVTATVVDNCPSLLGKPKLFFIQACQGEKKDSGMTVPAGGYGEGGPNPGKEKKEMTEEMVEKLARIHIQPKTQNDAAAEQTASSKAEVFIAMATVPDFVSWRNTNWGTWFVQAVIFVFSKYAHKFDIMQLMRKVNKLVSRGQTSAGYKQVSMESTSMTSEFYFFPGLYQKDLVESHSEIDLAKSQDKGSKPLTAPVQMVTPHGATADPQPQSATSQPSSLGSGVVAQPSDSTDGGSSVLVE